MNFKLPADSRQLIVDEFLSKNNADFGCATTYDEALAKNQKLFALLADGYSDLKALEAILHSNLKNIVQNSYWPIQEKLSTLFSLAHEPKKFLNKDFTILADATHRFEYSFDTRTGITRFIDDIFSELGIDPSSTRAIPLHQTLTELIMNAQHTAPANVSKVLFLKEAENSELIIEKNKQLLAISVIDYYGSLKIDTFLKKIETSLKVGVNDSINFGYGGAGLGGTLVYNHCDTMMLCCEQFEKTRVTAVLPYNLNEDKLSYIQKSICILD